ncbi:DNA replication complex GINS family protein [Candidatus Micrarchaeota archaeon]|nr:DNA replication complex GINS family protein [Candidatus Micrarchaeota archaeon]
MLSYSTLREIQKKELESGALVELDEDFYSQVSELLQNKKEEALASSSMLSLREYENIKKIVLSIQGRREEKILLMALRSEKSHLGLTLEEQEMLLSIRNLLSDYRNKVDAIWVSPENEKEKKMKKVKMTRDVDEYKGNDDNLFGPFSKDEEYMLPKEEADWLVKAKMAEAVI